jgi:hypothetical protein
LNIIEQANIFIMGVPDEPEKERKNLFEEKMTENF